MHLLSLLLLRDIFHPFQPLSNTGRYPSNQIFGEGAGNPKGEAINLINLENTGLQHTWDKGDLRVDGLCQKLCNEFCDQPHGWSTCAAGWVPRLGARLIGPVLMAFPGRVRCVFGPNPTLDSRPAQIFLENWNKLHGQLWAKTWLDNNFQPIWMSFDHASEAPKLAIFKSF